MEIVGDCGRSWTIYVHIELASRCPLSRVPLTPIGMTPSQHDGKKVAILAYSPWA